MNDFGDYEMSFVSQLFGQLQMLVEWYKRVAEVTKRSILKRNSNQN